MGSLRMVLQAWVLLCLVFIGGGTAKGLNFTLTSTTGGEYCGQLVCWVNLTQDSQDVLTIVSLTISQETVSNQTEQLASVSTFSSHLDIDQSKVDRTQVSGHASRYEAELTINLKQEADCQSDTFWCRLDFIDLTGQSETQVEELPPTVDNDDLWTQIMRQVANLTTQIKSSSDKVNQELSLLEQKVLNMTMQNSLVNSKLDSLVDQLSRLKGVNVTRPDINQVQCVREMTYSRPRERILLWDQVEALCDTITDGGGWVIIQRRTTGDVDFYQDWQNYKVGFGTPDTDYWIGNDVIHNLTAQGYTELRVDMVFNGVPEFIHYSIFKVADEESQYQLTVGGPYGITHEFLTYNNHMNFTTYDRDNDQSGAFNCATEYTAGWWFNNCLRANLNGPWPHLSVYASGNFRDPSSVEMKVRLA